MSRLVTVPSESIAEYEKAGYENLGHYYNPGHYFDEVFVLSPLEKGERQAYGMTILGVSENNFSKTLKKIQPNVVRAYSGYWPADLACYHRVSGIPVVVSIHDTNPKVLRQSVCYADLVVCMSKAVEDVVLAHGVEPYRIRKLPNRVDFKVFRHQDQLEALSLSYPHFPSGYHILHVGRKTRQKNLDTLIRALQLLPASYSVIFIGHGDCSAYQALAKDCSVSERCFWIDSVKNSQLPLWYSWCDCFCVPSLWEGFGVVFIEAAACGVPIITSDIAPMNEYLTHDKSAYLVKEYENPVSVANAIRRVCEDAEYRAILSRETMKAAVPFDKDKVDAGEIEIYKEAMRMPAFPFLRCVESRLFRWKKQFLNNEFQ